MHLDLHGVVPFIKMHSFIVPAVFAKIVNPRPDPDSEATIRSVSLSRETALTYAGYLPRVVALDVVDVVYVAHLAWGKILCLYAEVAVRTSVVLECFCG